MEKYLNKCLDSLLIKTGIEYLEIIVVNDGSSDASLSIAQDYKKKFPNVFVIINKKNGNYGSCINAGLPIAKGKYIKILDADDSFSTPILEELIKKMHGLDVDLIITDYITIDENDQILSQTTFQYPELQEFNFPSFFINKKVKIPYIPMHNVAYKRENIINIKYKQTEGISYTDVEWTFIPITIVKTAFYLKKPLYKYLLGRTGQTVSKDFCVKNVNSLKILVLSLIKQYTIVESHLLPLFQQYLSYRILIETDRVYKIYFTHKIDSIHELIKFDEQIKKLNPVIYNQINELTINRYLKYIQFWRKNRHRSFVYPFLHYNLIIRNLIIKFLHIS